MFATIRENPRKSGNFREKNCEKSAKVEIGAVEARGRLGAEVLPFLRQHAPAEEPLRSAALARATRELSIITQRGLASLLLAAEPRPVAARVA